jgi:hypothetical protein
MTQYFRTSLITPNYKLNQPFAIGTALYVGPNPPPAVAGLGIPVAWTPPPEGSPPGTLGTLNAPIVVSPAVAGEKPTLSTIPIPMSQQDALSLGNYLGGAHYASQCAGMSFYTGGIVSVSEDALWPGPAQLYENAPNSESVGQGFVNMVNWMATNPFQGNENGIGWAGGFTFFVAGEILTGGSGVIIGLAVLGFLLWATPAGQSGSANFVAGLPGGEDYAWGYSEENVDWTNGSVFQGGDGSEDFIALGW